MWAKLGFVLSPNALSLNESCRCQAYVFLCPDVPKFYKRRFGHKTSRCVDLDCTFMGFMPKPTFTQFNAFCFGCRHMSCFVFYSKKDPTHNTRFCTRSRPYFFMPVSYIGSDLRVGLDCSFKGSCLSLILLNLTRFVMLIVSCHALCFF